MTLLYISIMFTLLLFYHSCTVYRKCFTFSLQTYDPNAAFCRNRMSDERLSGVALMHLHHELDIDLDEICSQTQEEDVPRVYPLRVESK